MTRTFRVLTSASRRARLRRDESIMRRPERTTVDRTKTWVLRARFRKMIRLLKIANGRP